MAKHQLNIFKKYLNSFEAKFEPVLNLIQKASLSFTFSDSGKYYLSALRLILLFFGNFPKNLQTKTDGEGAK